MRILIKILLSFLVLILSIVVAILIKAIFAPDRLAFLPSPLALIIILFGGLYGIWTYKPMKESTSDDQELDKS